MIKSIVFYGRRGSVKVSPYNRDTFESQRLYASEELSKNFIPTILKSSPDLNEDFNYLNISLTELFMKEHTDEIHHQLSPLDFNYLISKILKELNNSDFFLFFKYKINFEHEIPLPTRLIEFKSIYITKNRTEQIKFLVDTYLSRRIFGQDKVRKFELTIKL
jgi:hypothetical protein